MGSENLNISSLSPAVGPVDKTVRTPRAATKESQAPEPAAKDVQSGVDVEFVGIEKEVSPEVIKHTMDMLAQSANLTGKRVRFKVNKEEMQVVTEIVDRETNEVVRRIPSEEVQNATRRLREFVGLLFDTEG